MGSDLVKSAKKEAAIVGAQLFFMYSRFLESYWIVRW